MPLRRPACTDPWIEVIESRRLFAVSISSLTLYNADTDKPLGGSIANNGSITVDLKTTPSITFRAETAGASVRFGYDGQSSYRVESTAPFMFASDNGSDLYGFTPLVGTHTITATPFAGRNASGAAGAIHKITVKVVDTSLPTPPPTTPRPKPTTPAIPVQFPPTPINPGTPATPMRPMPPTQPALRWPTGWQSGPAAPSPRFESVSHVFGGKIYSFGGFKNSDFDVDRTYVSFDPGINRWTQLGTLPTGMAETHVGVADDGQYMYLVGGFAGDYMHGTNPPQRVSDQVWRFAPLTNQWTQLASLPAGRGGGGAAIVAGKLHYLGGNPADRVTNVGDHYVLNLANPSAGWTTAAPLPDSKDHASVIAVGTNIYVLGGEYGHDKLADIQKNVHMYDTLTNTWTRLADMPYTNSHAEGSTFVMDGRIIMAGGQVNHAQDATNRVIAYDLIAGTWKDIGTLPAYRQGAVVAVFGERVVVTLGAQYTTQPQSTTWSGLR